MSRTCTSHQRYSLYTICLSLLCFLFGQCYWQVFVHIRCISNSNDDLFYDHFIYRTKNTCTENRSNIFLTIAVLSSFDRLMIYLPSIVNTWALTTTTEIEIILFLEEYSFENEDIIEEIFEQLNTHQRIQACFYLVRLKYVENDYPPQKKSFYAMKYLYTFYRQRTSWLLRLDDNAYVHIEKLLRWLKSINNQRPLYIGQGGSGRRNGPAIHFPKERYFCMGGSGVILSQRTLTDLGPWLDHCLNYEIQTKHEDVELGRCLLSHLNLSCTNAYDSKTLFYHHYGPGYSFGYDFTVAILSQALILHPIKDIQTFQQIFAFYLREKQHMQIKTSSPVRRTRQNYVTFLTKIEFDLVRDNHYQTIDARWNAYIKEIIRLHTEKLRWIWHKHSSIWTLKESPVIFGYHRVIPSDRLELLVEFQLNALMDNKSGREIATARKRLYLRQKFSSQHRLEYREILLMNINQTQSSQLNLVVVSSNKDSALKRFVQNFQRVVLTHSSRQQLITLTILYFPWKNQSNEEILHWLKQVTVRYNSSIRLSIVEQTNITYNRGLGRHLASKLFTPDQILFFLDVDLGFTGRALDNTRRLMIHLLSTTNCTVYFPIVFSSYSHLFTDNVTKMKNIRAKNGLFSIYGFGNVAVRKGDLDRIGGWETTNYDWGNEDVNLFQRFHTSSIQCNIFRAVEPGLRHVYHKKMCNGITDTVRRKTCDDADITLLGSQSQMVDYILERKLIHQY